MSPLLQVTNLVKWFPLSGSKGFVHALNGVSFDLHKGETLGILGESGSGKSTLVRCVLGLIKPTRGEIRFAEWDIAALGGKDLRKLRAKFQAVFQNPARSLNPKMRVGEIIEEPLLLHTSLRPDERKTRVIDFLERVRLDPGVLNTVSINLSGGQQQRVAIARALAASPDLIVLDEPTSSLDMSVRGQILDLLTSLQKELNVAYLIASHDLSTVKRFCHRVAVMYLGKVVEVGTAEQVFGSPQHPYTEALMASIPIANPLARRPSQHLHREIPSPVDLPPGCYLYDRCPKAMPKCKDAFPDMIEWELGHNVACYAVEDSLGAAGQVRQSTTTPGASNS